MTTAPAGENSHSYKRSGYQPQRTAPPGVLFSGCGSRLAEADITAS
ncbi:hypothetical protein ACFSEO_15820 [Agromyces cerinus subsp. nitratus]